MAFEFVRTPFADNGDQTAIPNDNPPNNAVSYDQGFGADYGKDLLTDPDAKVIPRTQFNRLMNLATENIQFWQQFLYPQWIPAADNGGTQLLYPFGMRVRHNNLRYVAVVNDTAEEPGTGTEWILEDSLRLGFGFANVQVFTAGGTFTTPAGIQALKITAIGGGGGGGGVSSRNGGGGGGGGATNIAIYTGTLPASYTVSIGSGGAGGTGNFGAATGQDGADGGTTQVSAAGVTLQADRGFGGGGGDSYGRGGLGPSDGFISGSPDFTTAIGGGSGQPGSIPLSALTTASATGGNGGNSSIGSGGRGGTFNADPSSPAAVVYGAGGGGGSGNAGSSASRQDGADGNDGAVIFEW